MNDIKNNINDKKIAILATHGFEEIELEMPQSRLTEMGATVHLISDEPILKSWHQKQWNKDFRVDKQLDNARPGDYDLLILPGGVLNTDKLRRNEKIIEWIQEYHDQDKPIASICHGPQLLIEAKLVKGEKITSHHAIKTDLLNAGADYITDRVYSEGNFISAQGASDTEQFVQEIIKILTK
ncbi:MAG: type 1 glutamine amidotransferase [Bacteroidetes bacterium]|nr:type 1 glutamine amidotransferase [Bacteroidota bacterium]